MRLSNKEYKGRLMLDNKICLYDDTRLIIKTIYPYNETDKYFNYCYSAGVKVPNIEQPIFYNGKYK